MSHPLSQGVCGTTRNLLQNHESLKESSVPSVEDSVSMEKQVEENQYNKLTTCQKGGNVPDVVPGDDPGTLEELFDEVSTVETVIHESHFGVPNDEESLVCDSKTKEFAAMGEEIISQANEEEFGECPDNCEEEEDVAEAPLDGVQESEAPLEEENENEAQFVADEYEAPAHIDAFGGEGEFPGMSAYEILRERNIREREEFLREAMGEINEAKQDMHDNAPKKRRSDKAEVSQPKRRKVKEVEAVHVRRSERSKKPVCYIVDEDEDVCEGTKKMKKSGQSSALTATILERASPAPHESQECCSRSLRPRKPVCYTEFPEPDDDSYIWCSGCDSLEYHGCETHVTLFGDNDMFNLQVGESAIKARNAGQGIFNRGKGIIPEGTLFGPYTGIYIPLADYEHLEKEGKESGNAWEVKDKDGKKVVGYVDPGINPDPSTHWMSKVNCAMDIRGQNLVGFQLAGQIYYRAKQDIPPGRELLVFYGGTYAMGLGIDMKKYEKYSGEEDQTEDAVLCDFCHIGMGSAELAKEHGCKEKKDAEMLRRAQTGEGKWICKDCGKGFKNKSELDSHIPVHTNEKAYICTVEGCDKKYTERGSLFRHKKVVHDGVYYECEECGRRFGQKVDMEKHFQSVHLKQKNFKCPTCGVKFSRKGNLTTHIKTVHDQIKSFECDHCGKWFGEASLRKKHIEAVHLGIRYSCTWRGGCGYTTGKKSQLPFHVRQVHTKEWSWECQLCEDQKGIWWGCLYPGQMDKHKAKNHPLEWEEEQEAFRKAHPYACKVKKCGKRFATKVEVDRHFEKLH